MGLKTMDEKQLKSLMKSVEELIKAYQLLSTARKEDAETTNQNFENTGESFKKIGQRFDEMEAEINLLKNMKDLNSVGPRKTEGVAKESMNGTFDFLPGGAFVMAGQALRQTGPDYKCHSGRMIEVEQFYRDHDGSICFCIHDCGEHVAFIYFDSKDKPTIRNFRKRGINQTIERVATLTEAQCVCHIDPAIN